MEASIAEQTLSVTEAAQYSGVSIQTIRRWIYAGTLKASRPGRNGNWRVLTSDLVKAYDPQTEE